MSDAKKILIINDDPVLRETLVEQLVLDADFVCCEAENAARGIEMALALPADIILLDTVLPDMKGAQACQAIRKGGCVVPVIMLADPDNGSASRMQLPPGADDCLVRPFRFGVLLSRIRAHLDECGKGEKATLRVGRFAFRPVAKTLTDEKGKTVRLTEKETAILSFLHQAGARKVGRDVLLNEVWGYNARVSTYTLETHIYRLRQKLEKDPSRAELLVTAPGGYKLVS